MSSNHKQQNRFSSCERGKCAMQRKQHGGGSKAHPCSSRGSTLAAGAFTLRAPQPRLPRAATARAMSSGSFAYGFATNVTSLSEHTHKDRTPRPPRKMMPMLVTSKLLYNEADARCIWPSLSRSLTLIHLLPKLPHRTNRSRDRDHLRCLYMPLIGLVLSL